MLVLLLFTASTTSACAASLNAGRECSNPCHLLTFILLNSLHIHEWQDCIWGKVRRPCTDAFVKQRMPSLWESEIGHKQPCFLSRCWQRPAFFHDRLVSVGEVVALDATQIVYQSTYAAVLVTGQWFFHQRLVGFMLPPFTLPLLEFGESYKFVWVWSLEANSQTLIRGGGKKIFKEFPGYFSSLLAWQKHSLICFALNSMHIFGALLWLSGAYLPRAPVYFFPEREIESNITESPFSLKIARPQALTVRKPFVFTYIIQLQSTVPCHVCLFSDQMYCQFLLYGFN